MKTSTYVLVPNDLQVTLNEIFKEVEIGIYIYKDLFIFIKKINTGKETRENKNVYL